MYSLEANDGFTTSLDEQHDGDVTTLALAAKAVGVAKKLELMLE